MYRNEITGKVLGIFFFFACMHGEVQIYVIIICIFFLDIPIAACCTYNYNNTL